MSPARDDEFRPVTAILVVVAVPLAAVVLVAAYALAQHLGWVP